MSRVVHVFNINRTLPADLRKDPVIFVREILMGFGRDIKLSIVRVGEIRTYRREPLEDGSDQSITIHTMNSSAKVHPPRMQNKQHVINYGTEEISVLSTIEDTIDLNEHPHFLVANLKGMLEYLIIYDEEDSNIMRLLTKMVVRNNQ